MPHRAFFSLSKTVITVSCRDPGVLFSGGSGQTVRKRPLTTYFFYLSSTYFTGESNSYLKKTIIFQDSKGSNISRGGGGGGGGGLSANFYGNL